jgi:hypothetical protein
MVDFVHMVHALAQVHGSIAEVAGGAALSTSSPSGQGYTLNFCELVSLVSGLDFG